MESIEEQVVEWREGELMTIDIYDGDKIPPFKNPLATIHAKPQGDKTLVTMTFEYGIKLGAVGGMMNAMMVRSQFEKAVPRLLQGPKIYAETGKHPTREALRLFASQT